MFCEYMFNCYLFPFILLFSTSSMFELHVIVAGIVMFNILELIMKIVPNYISNTCVLPLLRFRRGTLFWFSEYLRQYHRQLNLTFQLSCLTRFPSYPVYAATFSLHDANLTTTRTWSSRSRPRARGCNTIRSRRKSARWSPWAQRVGAAGAWGVSLDWRHRERDVVMVARLGGSHHREEISICRLPAQKFDSIGSLVLRIFFQLADLFMNQQGQLDTNVERLSRVLAGSRRRWRLATTESRTNCPARSKELLAWWI
jgi:hypothetical protein